MSWTYFTSFLDGSRPITKNERDEIYTQLAAKFTDCAAMFSLNATDQAAIVASLRLTDRASLDNSDDSSNTLGNLAEIIEATSAVWHDYAGAKAAALAAEGISSGDLDDIIDSRLNSHHLWNYYKRIIDLLVCCTVPESPTIQCSTRSASLSKCGCPEFEGFESTPPKFYRTVTQSGSFTHTPSGEFTKTIAYTGNLTWPRPCGAPTDTGTGYLTVEGTSCVILASSGTSCDAASLPAVYVVNLEDCSIDSIVCYATGTVINATTKTFSTEESCPEEGATGGVSLTLSNEYTTSQLLSDVNSALSAAGWSAYGACSSSTDAIYDVDEDEVTITKRECNTRVSFDPITPGVRISYDIWDRTSDTLVSHGCSPISAGSTEFTIYVPPPSTPGDAHYVTNIVLECAEC